MKQARIAGQSEKTGCGLMAPKVKSKVHTEEQVLSTMPAEPPAGPCAWEGIILSLKRWTQGSINVHKASLPSPTSHPWSGVHLRWGLPTIASLSECARDSYPLPPQQFPRLQRAYGGYYQCPPVFPRFSLPTPFVVMARWLTWANEILTKMVCVPSRQKHGRAGSWFSRHPSSAMVSSEAWRTWVKMQKGQSSQEWWTQRTNAWKSAQTCRWP